MICNAASTYENRCHLVRSPKLIVMRESHVRQRFMMIISMLNFQNKRLSYKISWKNRHKAIRSHCIVCVCIFTIVSLSCNQHRRYYFKHLDCYYHNHHHHRYYYIISFTFFSSFFFIFIQISI